MGNRQSAPPCGAPVTARPANPSLTERDARSLHELYAHDAELLRLMSQAEALRDLAKRAHDACATHFQHALIATKHEQAFGESLVEMSRRMHALGAPVVPPSSPRRARESLGSAEPRDPRSSDEPPPGSRGEKVSDDVHRLARKLGDAFVATAVSRGRVYARLLANVEALARDVERAHRVSLESAAKAHEKAYNQIRAPRRRLERFRAKTENGFSSSRDDDDSTASDDEGRRTKDSTIQKTGAIDHALALKIDQAEVDLGKRVGIMKETTIMLRRRARIFVYEWTPKIADAFRGLNFAQRDALHADSQAFGEGCLVHDDCDGSTEAARRKCREYLTLDSVSLESDSSDGETESEAEVRLEGRVAPRTTPTASSADIKGKAKAAAA